MSASGGFSDNALKILKARYFLKNEKGDLLDKSPEDLFRRVATYVATAEKSKADRKRYAQLFLEAMNARDFLPNSPTLTGAGRGMCLSACFVLPIEDSLDSIFDTVKNAALVHKEGGGTGFDFSLLRPKGSFVRKTQGVASGPVSFLKVIDAATEAVKQGGTRRGANMGILRVDHPDIEEFIQMKLDGTSVTNFNISVAVTDAFMAALAAGAAYDVIDPHTGAPAGKKDARKIFQLIVESAWAIGDPGLIFIDRINAANPDRRPRPHPGDQSLRRTAPPRLRVLQPRLHQPGQLLRPQGEGPLRLGPFPRDRPPGRPLPRRRHRRQPLPAAPDRPDDPGLAPHRPRGHGLGRPAPPDEGPLRLGQGPGPGRQGGRLPPGRGDGRLARAGRRARLVPGHRPVGLQRRQEGGKMRNATVFTIAPTGTISRIAGCSSSIEPVFAFEVTSKIIDSELKDVHPIYAEWKEKNPGKPLPDYFKAAHEIAPEWHIKTQAAFQKHVDNSVSKTINFPHEATVEDVEKAYMLAWDLGTKGITIYRDGCRESQVLYKNGTEINHPEGRPDSLPSVTDKIKTGFGNLYVTISFHNQKPFEVFASIGKSGYSTMADAEALGRLISTALRSGVEAEEVITQLKGIGGSEPIFTEGGLIQSIPDAIAKILEKHFGEVKHNAKDFYTVRCKICGALLPDEKCPVCINCGWSKCA